MSNVQRHIKDMSSVLSSVLNFSGQVGIFPTKAEIIIGLMSHEQHCWQDVDDYIENFNPHHARNKSPSAIICSDESISCWYVQGGH